jgi:CheY-like chemotaxis protein
VGVFRLALQPSISPNPEHRSVPTVLVVDDEVLLRLSIADLLREEGFSVIEAANADEAIAILQTTTPIDIVVTDVAMPGTMDGIGLTLFIRANRPDLKVIMTSGNLLTSPAGCQLDGFFLKPYDACNVAQLIRSLLRDAAPLPRLRGEC